jgi:hypothetical protein
MRKQVDHQTELQLGGLSHAAPTVARTTRKANKRHLPVIQSQQASSDGSFAQKITQAKRQGLPASRSDCPTERPCPHVTCRFSLAIETGEHRAGRPGLAHVPRSTRGWTVSATGSAGKERPGSTLRPVWMETERHCRAWLEFDSAGQLCAVNVYGDHMQSGSAGNGDAVFDAMRLHEGEELRVVSDDGKWATRAKWKVGAIVLERAPLIGQVVAVLITRVRPVSSCALDEIQRHGKMTNEQIGDAIGRHRTLVARQAKVALRKAVQTGREVGIEPEDLLGALIQMGEER